MEILSRIQISNQMLLELYDSYKDLNDQELSSSFYAFLVDTDGKDSMTQKACFQYSANPKELRIRKNDMILELITNAYGFFRYVSTFNELSSLEKEILNDLDHLPYSIADVLAYFKNPNNQEKMELLLSNYFIYMTQDDEFIEGCEAYLYNEPTEFYERMISLIKYVEVMDMIAIIYEEIMQKYESGEVDEYELFSDPEEEEESYEEEEEYSNGGVLELAGGNLEELEDEDSYENMIRMQRFKKEQEDVFNDIANFLENYYLDKFELDDFIGYFMSFVYAFLLKAQREQPMTLEDEEMLKMLSRKELSFEYAVNMFYSSKEYVFNSVDLFVQEYYASGGDIFSIRENFNGRADNQRFNILDSYYIGPAADYNVIYIGSPIASLFTQMLLDIKEKNPDDYVGEIYQLLCDPTYDTSLFSTYGFNQKYIEQYRVLLMRFLARKYVELVSFNPIASFSLEELFIYQGLMHIDVTNSNMKSLFLKGYYLMVPAFYEMMEKGATHEKCIVRKLRANNLLANVARIDSSCITDENYRKALQESEFYSILEQNGEKTTIAYLKHLFKTEPGQVMEYLKELLLANYYYVKEENADDAIALAILNLIEGDSNIGEYFYMLLQNDSLLEELLSRYLAQETKTKYPLSYQEKLEQSPKIKQKLYPDNIYG